MMTLQLLACLVIGIVSHCRGAPVPPKFNDTYLISGTINLPYAEILEPFTAYYDKPNARSRIDYYNGVSINIQRGAGSPGYKYGVVQAVVFYTDGKVYNHRRCFETNGTADSPASLINVLPDLSGFTFQGTEKMLDTVANVFQEKITIGKKISTYTFYANATNGQPIMYVMMGYDSLLGSHFDKYIVTYKTFQSPKTFKESDFDVPFRLKCGSFPGPGKSTVHSVSPIHELIHRQDQHVDDAFEDFKVTHNKKYNPQDHENRKHIFRQNLRYINSKNRAGLTYSMKVNHLADLTMSELKARNGYRSSGGAHGGKPFDMKEMNQDIPSHINWNVRGAVTPVKDQGICGSCWSFGTTGTIEGAYFLKTGNLLTLSQQELMDCSWAYGNNACDGGEAFRSYQYIINKGGITTEELYGHYLAADGRCLDNVVKPVVVLKNYTIVPQGDENALKVAVFNKGPVTVAIDASHKSLSFYSSGVYYEPKCKNGPDDLDHQVLAVGYGTLDGQDYWLVKNSWSTYWGNDGYVLMSMKDNNCGVATAASYPEIA